MVSSAGGSKERGPASLNTEHPGTAVTEQRGFAEGVSKRNSKAREGVWELSKQGTLDGDH